jgi:hypothetical protein
LGADDVIFTLGEPRVRLTSLDVLELLSRATERNLQAQLVHSELRRALRSDPGKREVDVTEDMRQELVRILDAVRRTLL